MTQADVQKAYRQRVALKASRHDRLEEALLKIRAQLGDTDKPAALKILAIVSEALGY